MIPLESSARVITFNADAIPRCVTDNTTTGSPVRAA